MAPRLSSPRRQTAIVGSLLALSIAAAGCSSDGEASATRTAGSAAPATTPGESAPGTSSAPATSASGPSPSPVDVCEQVTQQAIGTTLGGRAGSPAPVSVAGAAGACRWSITGTPSGDGTLTVSVAGGDAAALAAGRPAGAVAISNVGQQAYTVPAQRTVRVLREGRITTLTADFGPVESASPVEAGLQTGLVGLAGYLASGAR